MGGWVKVEETPEIIGIMVAEGNPMAKERIRLERMGEEKKRNPIKRMDLVIFLLVMDVGLRVIFKRE